MKITDMTKSFDGCSESITFGNKNNIFLGGLLSNKPQSFIGTSAIQMLNNYKIDNAFMSTTAVDAKIGSIKNSFHDSEIKKRLSINLKKSRFN